MTPVVKSPAIPGGTPPPVFDRQELLERCLGSEKLAERCLTRFSLKLRADAESIRQLATDGDRHELAQTAHRVKGSALTVAAPALAGAAAELEKCARSDESDVLLLLVQAFLQEVDRFLKAVAESSSNS